LSTIEHADVIVVMQAGQIVETGSHVQLIASGGMYAQLYKSAEHGIIEDGLGQSNA